MNKYKQILEAINRGIKFALDDFEDQDDIQGQSNSKAKYKGGTREGLDETNYYQIIERIKNKENVSKQEYEYFLSYLKYNSSRLKKYQVKDKAELHQIISYIVYEIDPCANLNWLDVSNITNMNSMFQDMPFNGNISEWDVSQVKDMAKMFNQCIQFTGENTNLSNWNVSNVENMNAMFNTCSFNGIHNDLANWDVSKVKDMGDMFAYTVFNSDISKWDVSHVEYMDSMFQYSIFNQPIGNWNMSRVRTSTYMFFHASKFNQDLTKWDAKNLSNNTFKFSEIDLDNLPKGKQWILR